MLTPRKPTLLLRLLNLVLSPLSRQTIASSNRPIALPQHPPASDRSAWRVYWKAQGQLWRREPEIDAKRQMYLAERRSISPDIEQGIYPFKDIKLSRADVEWLLATHEHGQGPLDWSDESQWRRTRLDLRGADLCQTDLKHLPLTRMKGGLSQEERKLVTPEQCDSAGVRLEGADLSWAHLENASLFRAHLAEANLSRAYLQGAFLVEAHLERANLTGAHLERSYLSAAHLEEAQLFRAHLEGAFLNGTHFEKANLQEAHLEGAGLRKAHLGGAVLREAFFDTATNLKNVIFNEANVGFALLVDVRWGGVNLAVVNWEQLNMLGDEYLARQKKTSNGEKKEKAMRIAEHQAAVRANRQLAVGLREQGMHEEANRFAYHAQVLQRRAWWFQMVQPQAKLRQRVQALGAWLFSESLFLIAGHGYRPSRSFLAYLLVICGFATAYSLLGHTVGPALSPLGALVFSMTSFHGRGFFPGNNISLDDPLTVLAALEALVGLIIEVTFIATLTQRFFNR